VGRLLRPVLAVVVVVPLALAGVVAITAAPASAATRAFTAAFTANVNGDIMIRGNSMMTCPSPSTLSAGSSTLTCGAVQNGTSSGQNNNFDMAYVDIDSNPATFDSSSATVTIPSGATVLYAGLSWGGDTAAGSGTGYPGLTGVAAPTPTAKNVVDFQAPGASGYTALTSTTTDNIGTDFQGYDNVTSTVAAAGSGTYTVANVQAGTGGNSYAGWSLVVAYQDPTQPMRNLVVYTGYNSVALGTTVTIPISGFTTPPTGPVVTRLGVVVYEGDRGNVGDSLSLGPDAISNALNPVNDVENSSITDLGTAITARSPDYNNTLGIDIDRFDATGLLANGQTSTSITLPTVGDGYFPGVVTLATNLYSPSLNTTTSVADVNGGTTSAVKTGDVLTYSMKVTNIGADTSATSVLTDAIPAGATYVPGSITLGGTHLTDASGDDAGSFAAGVVTVRLGTGATPSAGGTLAVGASAPTVTFQVTINAGDANGTVISSAAALAYSDSTSGKPFTGTSNSVTSTVAVTNVDPVLAFPAPPAGEVGAAYTDTLTAAGGTAPYTWASTGTLPPGVLLNATTGVLSGTPTTSGTYNFTVSATDANGQVATEATSVYVAPLPVISAVAPASATVNTPYSAALGVNPGTGPYVWSISTGSLPAGITLNSSTGVLSGTPTASGTSAFTVRVIDSYGNAATFATSLSVVSVPAMTYNAPPTAEVSTPYSDTLTESGGTSPFTWTTTGTVPAWLTLSSAGVLSGTPPPTAVGSSTFTVVVTDVNGATASESTTVTVVAGPVLATVSPPGGEVGAAYSYAPSATGGTAPYTWSTTGTLPAGVTINSTTGVLSGVPTTAGTYNFSVVVTDANGQTATQATSISVVAGPVLATVPPGGEVGAAYTVTFGASGGASPYAYVVSAGSVPAGLALSGAGVLSGTPSVAGTSSFTVRATDAKGQTAVDATSISVLAGPVLAPALPPAGTIGTVFSYALTASGGTVPYQWTVSAGSLPTGVSLNSGSGVLSGTPSQAGTFPLTVEVTDADGQSATEQVTLVVDPAVALTASAASVRFGTTVTFTATLTPSTATGTVTFSDLAGGSTASLGSASLSGGVATLTVALPAFGLNTVTATYGGNATLATAASPGLAVQVNGYQGEVIIDEFRLSGPGGANDQYVELYNASPVAVPLAGFGLLASSGGSMMLPNTAPTLPAGHAYLITGAGYSLGAVAPSDATETNLGLNGLQVTAPDAASTVVDAVGSTPASAGFFSGTALPALSGTPTDQYAWVRIEKAGLPVNTSDNAADFKLVSTTGGVIGGVQSTLGSPAPRATGSPNQSNGLLHSTMLDPTKASNMAPNFVYVRGVAGQPGSLTLRRTITNTSGSTITSAVIRITALSEANGVPEPGATQPASVAMLNLIDPSTVTSPVATAAGTVTVENLSVDPPAAASPNGVGGLNTTLTVPLPNGGLTTGATVSVAFTFSVLSHGTYWFGYDFDALSGSTSDTIQSPAQLRLRQLANAARPQSPDSAPSGPSLNGAHGQLR
jgi:uncharacterized repeat protein (TIGR01451 family)